MLLDIAPTSWLGEFDELFVRGPAVRRRWASKPSAPPPSLRCTMSWPATRSKICQVAVVGTRLRYEKQWNRSAWIGRRTIAGRPVVEGGVVANPLAYAVATALQLAGATAAADVAAIDLGQYRVSRTSALRFTTAQGLPVGLGLTLCASAQTAPRMVVPGRTGQAVCDEDTDTVEVTGAAGAGGAPDSLGPGVIPR